MKTPSNAFIMGMLDSVLFNLELPIKMPDDIVMKECYENSWRKKTIEIGIEQIKSIKGLLQ